MSGCDCKEKGLLEKRYPLEGSNMEVVFYECAECGKIVKHDVVPAKKAEK